MVVSTTCTTSSLYTVFLVFGYNIISICERGEEGTLKSAPNYQYLPKDYAQICFDTTFFLQGIMNSRYHSFSGRKLEVRCMQGNVKGEWAPCVWVQSSGSMWSSFLFFDIFKICFSPLVWGSSHLHMVSFTW